MRQPDRPLSGYWLPGGPPEWQPYRPVLGQRWYWLPNRPQQRLQGCPVSGAQLLDDEEASCLAYVCEKPYLYVPYSCR
ncbi:unnamed protein product [Sphagnum jensenii]|uniref:Uncharacterized protein n=1 Tax=Sphagnum jensenii TaxID=128206 RepID=A0ABP0X2J4_9BRYO